MTILNYFDHHSRKANKEHFRHLIQVACADGVIDKSELMLLHRIGKKFGFTEPEINNLIESKGSNFYSPPYELEERFNQLYDIVLMALADDVLYPNEIKLIKRLVTASSFNEADSERLINLLVNGIKYGKSLEELFATFKQVK